MLFLINYLVKTIRKMAKDRRKIQHIHSSVPDKQPTPATLEVGEIAVNNAKNKEFLSIKNSDNQVVRM